MGIVNRRNAIIGWAVLKLGKSKAKKKAKDVVPSAPETARSRTALAAGVAAFFGVLAFWRKRKGGEE